MKTTITYLLKGALIGCANLIPGVSGGTLAVITGLYRRLIAAISGMVRFDPGWGRRFLFLVQVGAGALAGIVLGARGIERLLERWPAPTSLFFIGLIVGSLPLLYRLFRETTPRPNSLIGFAAGVAVVALLGLLTEPAAETGALQRLTLGMVALLFCSGAAGAAAMILPGISGAFILLLLGSYGAVLHAISERDIGVLLIVAAGAIVGLMISVRLIDALLRRHPAMGMAIILGLVVGSPVAIWPTEALRATASPSTVAIGTGAAILGAALTMLLSRSPHTPQ